MTCRRAAEAQAGDEACPAPGSSAPSPAVGEGTGISPAGQCRIFSSEGPTSGQRWSETV